MITQPFQDDVFFLLGWGGGEYFREGIRYSRGILKGGYGRQTWAIKTIAERDKQTNKQTKNGAVALYWRPSEDNTAFGFYQTVLTLGEALMKLWVHVWRNEVLSKNYLVTTAAGRQFSPWSSGICPIDENQAIENYKWVGLWMDFQFFSSVMSISVHRGCKPSSLRRLGLGLGLATDH